MRLEAMVACWAATADSGWTFSIVARTWPLLHVVALFGIEVGDAAEGGGAYVDEGLGSDLAGAADGGGEVLAATLTVVTGVTLPRLWRIVPTTMPATSRTATMMRMVFFFAHESRAGFSSGIVTSAWYAAGAGLVPAELEKGQSA